MSNSQQPPHKTNALREEIRQGNFDKVLELMNAGVPAWSVVGRTPSSHYQSQQQQKSTSKKSTTSK